MMFTIVLLNKKIGLLKMIKQPTYINYQIQIQTN